MRASNPENIRQLNAAPTDPHDPVAAARVIEQKKNALKNALTALQSESDTVQVNQMDLCGRIGAALTRPRLWLVGQKLPSNVAAVRDDLHRVWHRGHDGQWHDETGRHHETPEALTARTDLVEVLI